MSKPAVRHSFPSDACSTRAELLSRISGLQETLELVLIEVQQIIVRLEKLKV